MLGGQRLLRLRQEQLSSLGLPGKSRQRGGGLCPCILTAPRCCSVVLVLAPWGWRDRGPVCAFGLREVASGAGWWWQFWLVRWHMRGRGTLVLVVKSRIWVCRWLCALQVSNEQAEPFA